MVIDPWFVDHHLIICGAFTCLFMYCVETDRSFRPSCLRPVTIEMEAER